MRHGTIDEAPAHPRQAAFGAPGAARPRAQRRAEKGSREVRGSGGGVVFREMAVFTGNAHRSFAEAVCRHLEMPLGACEVFEFSNENIFVRFLQNIRERDVFLIQPIASPVNTRLMELLIMIDAAKRASAGRITAVVPYFAYGRSDKKDQPHVPISARMIANFIEVAGADRLLTMDLHARPDPGLLQHPRGRAARAAAARRVLSFPQPRQPRRRRHRCRRSEGRAQRRRAAGRWPGDRRQAALRQRRARRGADADRRRRERRRGDHRRRDPDRRHGGERPRAAAAAPGALDLCRLRAPALRGGGLRAAGHAGDLGDRVHGHAADRRWGVQSGADEGALGRAAVRRRDASHPHRGLDSATCSA